MTSLFTHSLVPDGNFWKLYCLGMSSGYKRRAVVPKLLITNDLETVKNKFTFRSAFAAALQLLHVWALMSNVFC